MALAPVPSSLTSPSRDTCYFDGRCGLCRRSATLLRHLDWLNRLKFTDQTTLTDAELPIPRDAALRGMPLRTRHGVLLIGYPAVRRALLQTPPGFVLAALMYVPILSKVARLAYEHVAANRGRDACEAD